MTIQLVLTRPEPTRFQDVESRTCPILPPKVWWSAAALCGLKHGYKKLAMSAFAVGACDSKKRSRCMLYA